jgi:hypothetical protein
MENSEQNEGCASIVCYRSVRDPTIACIVQYWTSLEAIDASYARAGDIPWQFMDRAGNPEHIDDTLWQQADVQ